MSQFIEVLVLIVLPIVEFCVGYMVACLPFVQSSFGFNIVWNGHGFQIITDGATADVHGDMTVCPIVIIFFKLTVCRIVGCRETDTRSSQTTAAIYRA